jgi:hypothetical protein
VGQDTVTPADITRALAEAGMSFNEGLWGNVTEKSTAFLYLAAHYLVLNVQAAGGLLPQGAAKGIKSGGGGVVQSKSVGSVSVSYALPQSIIESPILGQYMRTDFGQKYLALIYPRLVGNIGIVSGQPTGGLSGE